MSAERRGPIDVTREAWTRGWPGTLLWVAGLGIAAGLMRLAARRLAR
ncbi:MAG TPA: hypothetical protein VFH11_09270 [Gemmatimonadota bacterium]|nr:hypothetical protein [Gemmatimonadota bacterium]